ncbi:MAG: hypothetical protein ABEK12_03860, partial [Candidatus Nanohaloarchaea archaeon]
FPYTFRDYAMPVNSKGHISTHIDWRDLQRVQAGRSIAWGAQPMFMGPYEPKAKEEDYDEHIVAYYGRIGEAWTGYANRFIARGDMLDRPDIDRGTVHIQNHIYGHDVDFTEDAILGRGWEAEEGDLGILLTNVAPDESRILEIDLDEQPYEVPFEPLVYRVRNGEYHGFEGSAGRLELGPSDVGLVGTVPATDGAQAALRRIEDAQDVDGVYQDVLQEAKRAFDDHAFEEAERLAERAIAATEEPTDSPASATQSDTYGTDRTAAPADPPVGGDGSGFRPGPGVGIAALVG